MPNCTEMNCQSSVSSFAWGVLLIWCVELLPMYYFPNKSLTRFSFSEDAAYVGKNSNKTRYRISQIYASSQREANMPINSSYIFNSSWPGSVHYTLNQRALVSPAPSVSWGVFNGWSFLTHLKCLMSLESFCTYTAHCREMQK